MPVEQIGLFAFPALPKLERIGGYEHTKGKIAEWRTDGHWIRV
jgi:hypothetical protein